MLESTIIDRGRGPEISGTRITVYDVLDYHELGWHRDMIAVTLSLSSQQVEVAIRYIEEHRAEVMEEYTEMLAQQRAGTHLSFNPSSTQRVRSFKPRCARSASRRSGGRRMRGILADINVIAQCNALLAIWTSATWGELWLALDWSVATFASLGLPDDASDVVIWRTCQSESLVLITANRNQRGRDSLESVIQNENQADCLPVVTISNANRLLRDRVYAESVAERLLEKLIAIDDFRSAGRIYVP